MKVRNWFTKTRVLVYSALSAIILFGGGFTALTSGVNTVGKSLDKRDSTLFERWHAPCDAIRVQCENDLFFASMKTQYIVRELVSEKMLQIAERKFREDSTKWRHQ